MPEFVEGWPYWAVFAFFWFGATARGQMFYWAGRQLGRVGLRGATTGWRARLAAWIESPAVDGGVRVVRRLGLLAIPLCYLTVGLQSAVLAAAGVVRIRPLAFTIAQIPGALAWATIYTTIGFALWRATVLAIAGSPWGIAALVVAALAAAGTIWWWRTFSRTRPAPQAR